MAHQPTSNSPANIDPSELRRAQDMWHNFAVGGKYTIIAICVLLIGLALATRIGFRRYSIRRLAARRERAEDQDGRQTPQI